MVATVAALRRGQRGDPSRADPQRGGASRDSSARHAGNNRPAPRCRRKLGQSLRRTLPLHARLAPRRLGTGNRHPWRRACLRGIGQGARHHLLGGQFQLQRPHRQDRLAPSWTRGQSFQPPNPRLLHHALRRPLPQRGAARHRGSLSRRAAHGRGPRDANGLAALTRQPQGEWRDLDHRRQQGASHGASEFPRRPHHSRHRAARHGAHDGRCGVAGVDLAPCAWQVPSHDRAARRGQGWRRRQARLCRLRCRPMPIG